MTYTTLLLLLFALWTGPTVSLPATKLEPVMVLETKTNNDTMSRFESGTSFTDRVELNLPLKINKDELVKWITHAMRIMASRINITLAAVNPETMPIERMDLLKNCSMALNRLIDKMSNSSYAKKMEKLKSSDFKKKTKSDCTKTADLKLTTDKTVKLCDKPKNLEMQRSYNPITKYVQELTIVDPYNDARSKIFRDPNIFPPYDVEHQISLPLESNHGAEEKNFYGTIQQNISDRIGYARQDPLQQFLDNNARYTIATSQQNTIDPSHFGNFVNSILANHQLGAVNTATTIKPIISVPFEAYITIHHDTSSTTTTPMKATNRIENRKKFRDQDNRHEASTSNLPESVELDAGRTKKKNSGKTTILFEDEETSSQDGKKKKKKKKSKNQQPPIIAFIARMISQFTKNSTYPEMVSFIENLNKKPTKSKLVRFLRGKRNETQSEKQVDDDGGDIFDDGDKPSGNNDDYDYNEDTGSLGSLEDLIPLIIPILEDISDPESDTDLAEFLAAAVPLLQNLLEPDPETGEAPDIIGVLAPVIQSLFVGKDGMGSDIGAILGPLIQLTGPFIGPLVGPIIGPLTATLSGERGLNIGSLLSGLLSPLSQPLEPGGLSPLATVTADISTLILKELSKPGSDLDIGGLVSQIITGTISGLSATSSGGSKDKHAKPAYGPPPSSYQAAPPASQIEFFRPPPPPNQQPPKRSSIRQPKKGLSIRSQATQYRPQATHPEIQPQIQLYNIEQLAAPANYGNYGVPAHTVNPLSLLGDAFKDIIASGVNLVTSFISASTAASGASSSSSSSSSHEPSPVYGPPPGYGYH